MRSFAGFPSTAEVTRTREVPSAAVGGRSSPSPRVRFQGGRARRTGSIGVGTRAGAVQAAALRWRWLWAPSSCRRGGPVASRSRSCSAGEPEWRTTQPGSRTVSPSRSADTTSRPSSVMTPRASRAAEPALRGASVERLRIRLLPIASSPPAAPPSGLRRRGGAAPGAADPVPSSGPIGRFSRCVERVKPP